MKLLKVHGSGNDFFLMDLTKIPEKLPDKQIKQLARNICDRQDGFHGGADGLLIVMAPDSMQAVAKMRVINADGSEASMCGNGLRTIARYLSEQQQGLADHSFLVETMHADLQVKKAQNFATDVLAYEVEISPVSFSAADIGMKFQQTPLINQLVPEFSETLKFSALAVPNPHLIAFVDEETLKGNQLVKLASKLNGQNDYFPDGINVSFVQRLARNQLFVRTFERGVGLTNACGTAMSAASLMAAYLEKDAALFEKTLQVYNPGGMIKTIVHRSDESRYWISLIGNATVVADVSGDLTAALNNDFSGFSWEQTNEDKAYQRFIAQFNK